MSKKFVIAAATFGIFANAFSSGYKIPEQSLRSMGTAATYFSSADSADASFYNPANMSFLDDNKFTEIGLRYIHLGKIKFEGQAYDPLKKTLVISNAKSKAEDFYVPYFHFVSSSFIENARLGISFITPAGLSKRWDAKGQQYTAEEFTLEVYELDTSVSYKILENLSVAATGRLIYAKGKVKYKAFNSLANNYLYRVDMEGDTSLKTGWGVSASYKPLNNLTLSTIYRSKVDLDISGTVNGNLNIPANPPNPAINRNPISPDGGSVSIPLPAEWKVGTAYKLNNTTFEFTFERTFWSKYKKLDFNFADPYAEVVLGNPKDKNWKDSNAYRFAVYHTYNPKLTVMAGFAYDETPIPERTLGFELPDSDGYIFSLGGVYSPKNNMEIGIAGLYVTKKDRNINNNKIKGKFSDLNAFLINVSLGYKF